MTVENMFRLMATHPPPPVSGDSVQFAATETKSIQIPSRRRHPSLGSTGSYEGGSSTSGSPPGVNPTRYKTELCRPYEESGYCKYGEKCQFAHGVHEIRSLSRHPKYKTELCRTYHTVGFCPYGPRCHFIHNEDELKLCQINQQKQQQILQQMAQVAQQQALTKLSFNNSKDVLSALPSLYYQTSGLHPVQALDLCFPMLPPTLDSPPPSVTDTSSPSLSPSSILSPDDVFRIATPPPGFTAPPPVLHKQQGATITGYTSLETRPEREVPRSVTPPRPKMGLASLPKTKESWQYWQSPSILSNDFAGF